MKNIIQCEDCKILINGVPTKIISGSTSYFRIHPEYWRDRLLKIKEMGCNCIETYVTWNVHEKNEGEFDFSGWNDVSKFLKIAQEIGLYAIVRPGPYICSEYEFGGLPWWLLKYPNIRLRTSDPLFLNKLTPYLTKVCEELKPNLFSNGGNIIFWQIENEYGSFGNDKKYLEYLKDLYLKHEIDCAFITSDGDSELCLKNGSLEGVMSSVNYRWNSPKALSELKRFNPNQPLATMELWNGKGFRVGDKFQRRDLAEVEFSIKSAIELAELVSIYVVHGGTNFGLANGMLDQKGQWLVQPTSYDCDGPIDEYGRRTEKYYCEQKIIHDYLQTEIENTCKDAVLKEYGKTKFIEQTSAYSSLEDISSIKKFPYIPTMEEADQSNGVIIYETTFFVDKDGGDVFLPICHDIAHVYIDGEYITSFDRHSAERKVHVSKYGDCNLKIIVENLGRVNYGVLLKDNKGLIGDVTFFDATYGCTGIIMNWQVTSMELNKLPKAYKNDAEINKPAFYKYELSLDELSDTILHIDGFTRGVAFINGICLGRHFDFKFSQNRLYVPAPFLKKGKNIITIFDIKANDKEKIVELSNIGLQEQN